MSLRDYIHNLQQKPVKERERIAVIATAVSFSLIFVIWLVSFNEMNQPDPSQVDQTSASLNDLNANFQSGKDSIQNMMNQLPATVQNNAAGTDTTGGVDNSGVNNNAVPGNTDASADPNEAAVPQNVDNSNNSVNSTSDPQNRPPAMNNALPDQKNSSVPQLP